MINIGITGSLGSGKTAILNYLIECGYKAFSCDRSVHELYDAPHVMSAVLKAIPELKQFDKNQLSQIIYADPKIRKILEELMHPMVAKLLEAFLKQNSDSNLVFSEIPLLFEAGWEKYCDVVITLHCDAKIRLQRVTERGMDPKIFGLIEASQLPEATKIAKADFIIDTSASWEGVVRMLEGIIKKSSSL